MRKHPKPLLHEERVYADVLPFVRIYQELWLVGAVFFILYLAYGWLTGIIVVDGWVQFGTYLIGLVVFTAVFLGVSIAVCRMSGPFGCIWLFMCISGVCLGIFSLLAQAFFLMLRFVSGPPAPLSQTLVLVVILGGTSIPFVYLYYLGLRAGWRCAFSEDETKRIVSEIDPNLPFPSGWFSKVFAMPIPKKHLSKNRALTATLFIVSGLAFSYFPFLAGYSVIKILTMPGHFANISAFRALVFVGLSVASLLVGLAARAGGRRLMISSIRETQEHDPRPPILFLRAFRDDEVELSAPRIPLLGRLVNIFQRKGSLDIVLLEEGTAYGPVVAVGEPGEPVSPYGASRGYFAEGEWQKAVAQLADESRCIVICLDETQGVLWELDHILTSGHGPKTLFVMNPGAREVEKNKALVREVIARFRHTPRWLPLNSDEPIIGFFFDEGRYAKVGFSDQFSEASYLLMVRWFLRTAMDGTIQ